MNILYLYFCNCLVLIVFLLLGILVFRLHLNIVLETPGYTAAPYPISSTSTESGMASRATSSTGMVACSTCTVSRMRCHRLASEAIMGMRAESATTLPACGGSPSRNRMSLSPPRAGHPRAGRRDRATDSQTPGSLRELPPISAGRWYFRDPYDILANRALGGPDCVSWTLYAATIEKTPPDWIIPIQNSRLILARDGSGFLVDCGSRAIIDEIAKLKIRDG